MTGKCLSAGYPDLLVPLEDLKVATQNGEGEIYERPESKDLQAYHGFNEPIYDSAQVFGAIGLELHVIDRERLQGCESIVDLNRPASLGEYDLVIDPGTLEHCFNIAQAAVNLAGAVKVGGYISQAVPMSMFNHGYYNLNPVWFLDFYENNGFKIERLFVRHVEGVFENVTRQRLKAVPEEAVIVMLAKRERKKDFEWPQQRL